MKKIILCILFIIIGLLYAQGTMPQGQGTEENPFLVTSLDNLRYISEHEDMWLNKHYLQTNDIDASDTENWNDSTGFDGFGELEVFYDEEDDDESYHEYHYFDSTYSGNGFTIFNLYSHRSMASFISLLGENGIVENLNFSSPEIIGSNYSAVIAAHCNGLVRNCNITDANVVCMRVGFVTALLSGDGKIINCDIEGEIAGYSNYPGTGIIAGYVHDGQSNTGQMIIDCSARVIFGDDTISNQPFVKGLIGNDKYKTVKNSYYCIENNDETSSNFTGFGGISEELFQEWLDNGKELQINNYLTHDGDDYIIDSPNDFEYVRAFYDTTLTYSISNDLDFSLYPNLNIPYTRSSFEGNNHTICNITFDSDNLYVAPIGIFRGEYFQNLNVSDGNVIGYKYVSLLIADNYGNVSNCHVTGNVTGQYFVGGMIGNSVRRINTSVLDCSANVTIVGESWVGGLLGCGVATNCNAYSVIDASSFVGGMIGVGCAINCNVETELSGSSRIGGLLGVGYATASSSIGTIEGVVNIGGLIGYVNNYESASTNISEDIERLEIMENNFSSCEISGVSEIGGLYGYVKGIYDIIIKDSYSIGQINISSRSYSSSQINSGGFIGETFQDDIEIRDCYTASEIVYPLNEIEDISSISAFIGNSTEEIDIYNCFCSEEIAGVPAHNGANNVTIAELHNINTYLDVGWDFANTWTIDSEANGAYPYLRIHQATPNIEEEVEHIQVSNILKSAYPNPFNPETTIEFTVKDDEMASLKIYNIKGQLVKNFDIFESGEHKIVWQGTNNKNKRVASGLYLYKLESKNSSQIKKVLMIK